MNDFNSRHSSAFKAFKCIVLYGFYNQAGTETAGADAHAAGGSILDGVYPLKVGVPAALGLVVRVAHTMSDLRMLATDFTFPSH